MRYFTPFIWIPVAFALAAQGGTAVGQEENADLVQARAQFEREVDFSARPIRDRYVSRLESLKRTLGGRGDARGAAAVQDEIDRVRDLTLAQGVLSKFAGTWKVAYTNGTVRIYAISADGRVNCAEVNASGPQKPKLYVKGNDVLLEIGDGNLERLSIKGKTLLVEHFNPKALYLAGPPNAKGTGTLVTAHKE